VAIRVAYLGPAGTYSEDALRSATGGAELEPVPMATIHGAVMAVHDGSADRALVPFENSIEGAVRPTLDALAFDATDVTIVGEHDQPISTALIARHEIEPGDIELVISHPQASAQSERFLRTELPQAKVRGASSTADAVREVAESDRPWAALGAASAAEIYDCVVLREGVEDEAGNVTRFVWLAPAGTEPSGEGEWRTTLSFSELGADHPGALVDALTEFSSRDVNLTRIESRPLRAGGLGRYMFFIDLEGRVTDGSVADAIEGLRGKAENVRVLGSYPRATDGIPGG
jgi:prephenate dehydratase